jgi:hypothetical protein
MRPRTGAAVAMLASGAACPCHVMAGLGLSALALLVGSAPVLTPEIQDGVHAVYLPFAVVTGALFLRR